MTQMLRMLSVAVAAATLAACSGSTTAPTKPVTPVTPVAAGRVFALMDPGASAATLQTFAALPGVDGLAFRVLWSTLEPAAGTYAWAALDTALGVARQQGKQLTIHVAPTAVGLPGWLAALGMASYTYTGPQGLRTDPVPWDTVYLARYRAFVTALGAHVQASGNMDLVASVSDPVPVPEMTIVGCQNHQLTGGIAYDRAAYLAAWDSTISTYAHALPGIRLFISAPIAFICASDGNDGQAFYTDVMRYASSVTSHAAVFAADLTALGSQRMAQAASLSGSPAIGLQTIWSSTSDPSNRMQGSLADAVCHGWTLGARYFEIYQPDLTSGDAAVQAAIASARTGRGC